MLLYRRHPGGCHPDPRTQELYAAVRSRVCGSV